MKNRVTTIITLIITFLLFGLYEMFSDREPRVLNVITPTIIQIDTNRNNVADEGETFCIPDIEIFTSNLTRFSDEMAAKAGLSAPQAIAVGYLADEYAHNLLDGMTVKLDVSDAKTPECSYADIKIGDEDYKTMLIKKGFTLKDGIPADKENFAKILKQAENLKLVILNHHSQKYHTLDCKYGRAAGDAVVLPEKDINKEASPCKFCHVDKHVKSLNNNITSAIAPPPNVITDGSLKLILTDFSRILKPDRNCSHQACKEFVDALNSSVESIDIALYGWAKIPAIEKALQNAVLRGVKVRIVYDTNTKNQNYYTETEDFLKLFEHKIPDEVLSDSKQTNMLMHNKFAVFDGKKVYTGSMNFSTTGFSGFNHNSVLLINSKQIADIYRLEFEQMYSGKFHLLKEKSKNNINLQIGNNTVSVYFSPQDKGFSSGVAQLIKNSKKYIYVPTFLFTHKMLKDELIAAKNRGVDVKIIIDATNTYGQHSVFKELRKSGIPVKVENYAGKMHAKSMIIDDEYLIIGSANFSNSGENKNDENMLIVKSPKLSAFYKDYFLYFWSIIPDKYLKYAPRPESKESIGSCYDGVDNNFDGKIDNYDAGCK